MVIIISMVEKMFILQQNFKYGVENVSINNVYRDQSDNDYLIIKGKDFTKYSAVYINDEKVDSEFLDENTLRVGIEKVTEDINVLVKQSYKGKLILQTSNSIIYTAAEDESLPAPVDNDESEQQTPSPTEDGRNDRRNRFSQVINSFHKLVSRCI